MERTEKYREYLTDTTRKLLEAAKCSVGNFNAYGVDSDHVGIWVRDYAYAVEEAGCFMAPWDIVSSVDFILKGARKDGWTADRIYMDGRAVYAAGADDAPIGKANLDNVPSLIFIVHALSDMLSPAEFRTRLSGWYPKLAKGLSLIELSQSGLVWNDPEDPHSPYGFADVVAKTGELFMESVLYWRSAKFMAEFADILGIDGSEWRRRADVIKTAVYALQDPETGLFRAASIDNREIDIWANCYAVYVGFPLRPRTAESISLFFADNTERYSWNGLVRHILKGENWSRLLCPHPVEDCQNGGYWAVPSMWVAWTILQTSPEKAADYVRTVLDYVMKAGVWKFYTPERKCGEGFVSSIVTLYGGFMKLLEDESFVNIL